MLGLTVLITEVIVVTKTQCLWCGLNNICRATRIWCVWARSLLDGSPRYSATGDVFVQICRSRCVAESIATGWQRHGMTPDSAGKIARLKQTVNSFNVSYRPHINRRCRTIL